MRRSDKHISSAQMRKILRRIHPDKNGWTLEGTHTFADVTGVEFVTFQRCELPEAKRKFLAIFIRCKDLTRVEGAVLRKYAPDVLENIQDSFKREYWQEHNCLL